VPGIFKSNLLSDPFTAGGNKILFRLAAVRKVNSSFVFFFVPEGQKLLPAFDEKVQLKKKHGDDKHVEQGRRLPQCGLLDMLDALDDAVIAVNESEEIRFCNRAGEDLLRHPADDLRGRLIWSIFRTRTAEVLRSFLCTDGGVFGRVEKQRVLRVGLEGFDGNSCFVNVQVAPLWHESRIYYLFILKWPGNASGSIWQRRQGDPGNRLSGELAVIQESIKGLGDILPGMLPEPAVETGKILFGLSEINRSLARLALISQLPSSFQQNHRLLAVKVMNLCLDYWTECRGADKFDLARESKLWTVYINLDGWERTQTLDKYCDVTTLPKRPNWKKIIATANFVLTRCPNPSFLRENLEIFSARLHSSMHG